MFFYRCSVCAPQKLFYADIPRDLASIAAPNIESENAGHGLTVFGIPELAVEPVSFRKLLLASEGRRPGGFAPLFACKLRQRNEDKRVRTIALKKTIEVGAVLVRRSGKFETINPELNFYRLVLVFFTRHSIRRSGADPDVVARSLAGAMRPHHVLAHVEAGLPKPFAEGAIQARRPDRQHAARAQRGAGGSQSGGAV